MKMRKMMPKDTVARAVTHDVLFTELGCLSPESLCLLTMIFQSEETVN